MAELNMDKICDILRDEHGIKAYVEQTGGGTATIYAGELRPVERESVCWYPASGAEGPDVEVIDGKVRVDRGTVTEDRWQACAGPGWFEGPGWTNGRADTADFYIGPDDDGESVDFVVVTDEWDEQRAAKTIAAVVRGE